MEYTDKNFEERVTKSDRPVLVDFWGSWCTCSQRMKPVLERLEEQYKGKLKIGFLNIDKNPQTSAKYKIEGTPTHILFKEGKIVERRVGAMSGKQLEETFKSVLESR